MERNEPTINSLIEPNIFILDTTNGDCAPSLDLPALLDMFEKANGRGYYAGGGGGSPIAGSTTTCCATGTCDING
jgi:hypothetical protein